MRTVLTVLGVLAVLTVVAVVVVARTTWRAPIVELAVAPSGAAEILAAPVPAGANLAAWQGRPLLVVTRAFGTVPTAVCRASPGPPGAAVISSAAGAFPAMAPYTLGPRDYVLVGPV